MRTLIIYKPINEKDEWKVGFIREIIYLRNEQTKLIDMDEQELVDILEYLCVG